MFLKTFSYYIIFFIVYVTPISLASIELKVTVDCLDTLKSIIPLNSINPYPYKLFQILR